jgi:hypothetical protein
MADNIKLETGKFTSAVKAEEAKAQSWIARHPGWTLVIGVVLLVADIYQALRHL